MSYEEDEPQIRLDVVDGAVDFLRHPKIINADIEHKVQFLQGKVRDFRCGFCAWPFALHPLLLGSYISRGSGRYVPRRQ